jgi:hypothetical protein
MRGQEGNYINGIGDRKSMRKRQQTEDAGGKKILNMPGHLISWSASQQNLQQ